MTAPKIKIDQAAVENAARVLAKAAFGVGRRVIAAGVGSVLKDTKKIVKEAERRLRQAEETARKIAGEDDE